ncbi:MAG: hypothetical protein WHS63_01270 [Tenuifilum sp.]|uniref:hypothetical protein n=1 Tax=Tenuifilum sp. TaxID=2760880 RepID=UPI003094E5C0
MRKLILLIILGIISSSSSSQIRKNNTNLLLIDGYLYGNIVEKPELERNNIYKREGVFTFSYRYFDKNGKEFFFSINKDQTWDFVDINRVKDNVVKDFKLEVLNSNMNFTDPIYYQTCISYIFDKNNPYNPKTGLIENERNIWFHPPREYLFQILELNPYPYIKYPLEIGHSWNWKLKIGDSWGDKRWKLWKGIVEFKYKYSIVAKKTIKTNLGDLDCFVIEGEAESTLGKTKLTSYFNSRYGFVRFDYTNIDNSQLQIVLKSVSYPMFKFF